MYHSITALLFRIGVKCENHAASILLLKRLFDIDNEYISFAKTERVDKQYYVDSAITRKEVEEMIKLSESFNKMLLDFISRIISADVLKYRARLKALVK